MSKVKLIIMNPAAYWSTAELRGLDPSLRHPFEDARLADFMQHVCDLHGLKKDEAGHKWVTASRSPTAIAVRYVGWEGEPRFLAHRSTFELIAARIKDGEFS